MSYCQINAEERLKLESWRVDGVSNGEIARRLGRHVSTVGRELIRNGNSYSGWYSARAAQKSCKRRRVEVNKLVHTVMVPGSALVLFVEQKLLAHWSPEQIAGRLKRLKKRRGRTSCFTISHERIYLWIYRERKDLIPLLRHSKKRRHRRKNGTKQREKRREEEKKRRIDTRPRVIERRTTLGHWEGDTVLGSEKTVRLLTHVERKSRYLYADKVERATAKTVREKTVRRFNRIPKHKRQTVTYDNGVEFSDHETTERDTGLTIYFAYPYHSWERGTNENTNGLLREFFPKKSAFKAVSQKQVDQAVRFLNTRPRKCLDYLTPDEVFNERGCGLN
jgi:transposase, IS30 family